MSRWLSKRAQNLAIFFFVFGAQLPQPTSPCVVLPSRVLVSNLAEVHQAFSEFIYVALDSSEMLPDYCTFFIHPAWTQVLDSRLGQGNGTIGVY